MPRGAKPHFTPEQDEEIVRRYASGETLRAIATTYGVSYQPIAAALERRGVERRSKSDYAWKATPENRAELVRLFNEGLSVPRIARRVGTGNDTVSCILREEGIQARYGGQNRRFKADEAVEVGRRYSAGESLNKIAEVFGTNPVTVRQTLNRIGVPLRAKGREPFWTGERVAWLREQHAAGRSHDSIGKDVGLTQSAISRKLRDLGVTVATPRARGEAHGSWKGGRVIDASGYVRVLVEEADLPLAGRTVSGGYAMEHRLVMARSLGRPLTRRETVHHINGDRTDNRLENLQLRQGQHGNGVAMTCLDCGSHNVEARPLK
jgi:DNA invertase Pin-like site-specific DNA recombinase